MNIVRQMEQATAQAEAAGYGVRYEYLGGVSGGFCEVAGRTWIFIDLALSLDEQLQQLLQALEVALPRQLRKAA